MINHSFDPHSPPIISAHQLHSPVEAPIERCLITFSHEVVTHALKAFDCEQAATVSTLNGDKPIYSLDYQGQRLAFYMSPITAAGAGTMLEQAAAVMGFNKVFCFGSCGALQGELQEGALILPSRAYRDEGLSYHYAQAQDFIEVKNADRLAALMDELRVPYVKGPVWTTDGIFRETRDNTDRRRAEGCIAVDMECSGLQAPCDFRGWEYYTFFYTGDQLDAPEWEARMLGSREAERDHQLRNFVLALELLSRL